MDPTPSVQLSFLTDDPAAFDLLLQDHFFVTCLDGCTIREFLCEQMHVCGDYTQQRIQTVFLNGQPVDDLDLAIVHAGDTVALSSAMPGLMGAMMRKNSPFKAMRDSISHQHEDEDEKEPESCLVRVRLFNFLARELAFRFLENGLLLDAGALVRFLARQTPAFLATCRQVLLNGQPQPGLWPCPPLAELAARDDQALVLVQRRVAQAA